MGLNPPFGVDGCLAKKFIDKALTFKPKLLILIVPIETERSVSWLNVHITKVNRLWLLAYFFLAATTDLTERRNPHMILFGRINVYYWERYGSKMTILVIG